MFQACLRQLVLSDKISHYLFTVFGRLILLKLLALILALAAPIQSQANVTERGGSSRGFRDYLHLFFPNRTNPLVGNSLRSCTNEAQADQPVKTDAHGNIIEECLPDTLYSWGSLAKIRWLESFMGEMGWSPEFPKNRDYIDTVANPTGSFGYGLYSIRIKLKPTVKFLSCLGFTTTCEDLPEAARKDTVIASAWGGGGSPSAALEYVICSPSVVESWSYGMPEHYDEIVKDVKWITGPAHHGDYQTYLRGLNKTSGHYEPLYFTPYPDPEMLNFDGTLYTEQGLKDRLLAHLVMVRSRNGAIHTNPQYRSNSKQERKLHFTSKWTIYFHDIQP